MSGFERERERKRERWGAFESVPARRTCEFWRRRKRTDDDNIFVWDPSE